MRKRRFRFQFLGHHHRFSTRRLHTLWLKQFPAYLNRWDSQQARNEGVFGIDSPFVGAGMPKAYSRDLRERVITAVETGASRREAAERFEVSVASAVKWLQRWYQ